MNDPNKPDTPWGDESREVDWDELLEDQDRYEDNEAPSTSLNLACFCTTFLSCLAAAIFQGDVFVVIGLILTVAFISARVIMAIPGTDRVRIAAQYICYGVVAGLVVCLVGDSLINR